MLYREADAEAIVEKIQGLVDKLDDANLEDSLAKPLIYQVASLFEELIRVRAGIKRMKTAVDLATIDDTKPERTASR